MRDQTIQFKCGCRYQKADLKYRRGIKQKNGKYSKSSYFCPEHNQISDFKISFCVDCGVEIINKMVSGKEREYCDEHKAERIKAHAKINSAKQPVVKRRKKEVMVVRNPVKAWSIRDAIEKDVLYIPCEKLFEKRSAEWKV